MKKTLIIGLLTASISFVGCSQPTTPTASGTPAAAGTPVAVATNSPAAGETPAATETPQAEGGLPYEFPAHQPQVEKGQFAFVPMASSVEKLGKGGKKRVTDFRPREVVKAGEETTTILDREEFEAPNSLVVPIPKEATAANGDIVVGSPQYGSWEVAIVTDASDPSKPIVHMFKAVYGGAKPEGDKFLSQYESGKFRVVGTELDPGSHALYPEGDEKGYGLVIKSIDDSVLIETFGGDLAVFNKDEVTAIPVKPSLKKDDKVQAPFGKGMDPATVTKVDEKIGRVWVTFDGRESQGEKCFCFGQILPG